RLHEAVGVHPRVGADDHLPGEGTPLPSGTGFVAEYPRPRTVAVKALAGDDAHLAHRTTQGQRHNCVTGLVVGGGPPLLETSLLLHVLSPFTGRLVPHVGGASRVRRCAGPLFFRERPSPTVVV